MNPILWKVIFLAWKLAGIYIRRQQAALTNEQRAELRAEEKKIYGTRWYEQRSEP